MTPCKRFFEIALANKPRCNNDYDAAIRLTEAENPDLIREMAATAKYAPTIANSADDATRQLRLAGTPGD